jgi:hypothetical protein
MYLSIFESGEKVAAEGLGIEPASLYCAFEQVTDGRKKQGKRYPLPLLLTLLRLRQTGRRNHEQWHRGWDQRTPRVAALAIELAEALSYEFHLE